ncbi:thiolase family protein [Bacteriovorax sp. DB6_IX]|uniref:thiolase family protein n=1 Tax=Bacteriovorax sp. DB6_IX TaxID=1353530 RepID=UPI00038A2A9F|nr:thiolase family protein [Bacteriovorax sp. DB6_IX]EQC52495.1 putative 3-oxoadipyl-CoA thiolase [Bacteriovorax sp. DB6_IX]
MKPTYIIHAKRTPIGRLGGKLSHVRVDDMLAHLFKNFKESFDFDMSEIDDVIAGCANQAGEDNRNLARMSALLAGLPFEVPGVTMNRLCASSLDAIIDGWARIQSGMADCILVGGAESMTRAPLVVSKGSTPFGRDSQMFDTTFGWRFPNPKMKEMFPLYGMGETAEEVAQKLNISREDQDIFALKSHQKAIAAWEAGKFDNEVLPVEVQLRKESFTVSRDEGPRADTTLEKMNKLRAVFKKDGTVTAGNASSMNDGAACVALVSEDFLKRHNLTPLAEITGAGVRGIHPNIMGLGPVESTRRLMNKFGKKISDFDVVELNEAFAAQSLGCIRELGLDEEIVNLNGGAISLGHPLGCSGARIVTTMTHIMQNDKALKEGLASMCVGVGQGVSLSLRNC